MSATPDRIGLFVIKYVVVPAILAAVGYFVVGPVVGRMSAIDKSPDAKAEMSELQKQADMASRAADASQQGKPVSPPSGEHAVPDVDLQIDTGPQPPDRTKPAEKSEDPTVGDQPDVAEPDESPGLDATPKPAKTTKAKPEKPAGSKPKTPKKPEQKLPDTPVVGGDASGDTVGG